MSETPTTTTGEGFEALRGMGTAAEDAIVREPKIDAQGRAYATGKRKNAIARVWIKPGKGTSLAFALLGALVWTALDAWAGWARQTLPSPWGRRALWLTGLIYLQVLLGALVAGNHAGLIYNDWPLMNGHVFPTDYAGPGFWATLAHSQGAVQLHHRLVAYLLVVVAVAFGIGAWRSSYLARDAKWLAVAVTAAVLLQACLGIVTLITVVPVGLGIAHQLMAAFTLCLAVAFAWRARRV